MNMKKLKKGERGFSLVELVIVVALAGLVGAAITPLLFRCLLSAPVSLTK